MIFDGTVVVALSQSTSVPHSSEMLAMTASTILYSRIEDNNIGWIWDRAVSEGFGDDNGWPYIATGPSERPCIHPTQEDDTRGAVVEVYARIPALTLMTISRPKPRTR